MQTKDSHGNGHVFDGFIDQPSEEENTNCILQTGTLGWNNAICSRTWSGDQSDNLLIGHVCETRTPHFETTFLLWIETFLSETYPLLPERWTKKMARFSENIRKIYHRPCAAGFAEYSGVSKVDRNGDAQTQLSTIISDMKIWFDTFLPTCKPNAVGRSNRKLVRWETNLSAKNFTDFSDK